MKTPMFLLTLVVGFILGRMFDAAPTKTYNMYLDLRGTTLQSTPADYQEYSPYNYEEYDYGYEDHYLEGNPSDDKPSEENSSPEKEAPPKIFFKNPI